MGAHPWLCADQKVLQTRAGISNQAWQSPETAYQVLRLEPHDIGFHIVLHALLPTWALLLVSPHCYYLYEVSAIAEACLLQKRAQ